MITREEIISELDGSDINVKLFDELFEEYEGIQKAFLRKDYEKVLNKTGKFCETVYQILEELTEGDYSVQPNFTEIKSNLENTERGSYPESIRIIIPRIAKDMYDLRSKRGGVHKADIDPQFIDSHLALEMSKWIVAEFLREYGNSEDGELLEGKINQVLTKPLPFVEEFEDGDIMLLIDPGSCREEVLLVLYHFYPKRLTNDEFRTYLDHQSSSNVLTSLKNAEKDKLVHRNPNGSKLTLKGRIYVEKKYGTKLEVEIT